MTAPWPAEVAELITGPHACNLSTLATPAVGSPFALEVVGGRIGWDEKRTPRVEAELVLALPDDPTAVLGLLDPRPKARVKLYAEYVLKSGTGSKQQVADLGLRTAAVDRPAGTITLTLQSDEALAMEAGPHTGSGFYSTSDLAGLVVQYIKNLVDPDPTIVNDYTGYPQISATGSGGSDYWDDVEEWVEQLANGGEVYDEGDRIFHLSPQNLVLSSNVRLTLKTGPGGIVTRSQTVNTRDDWANSARIRYEWVDNANANQVVTGSAVVTAGPYTPALVGTVTYAERRAKAVTAAGANAAARAVLARKLSRSRQTRLTAVWAWWLRPGQTVAVQLPEMPAQERHLVSSVDFNLDDGTMTVVTRLPDTQSTIT